MKIKGIKLKWTPSGSPDVESYNLYLEESPNPVTYESEAWTLGLPAVVDGQMSVDLSTLEGMTSKDGAYNIGLSSVDSAGNESSLVILEGVEIDFEAPDPPSALTVERF